MVALITSKLLLFDALCFPAALLAGWNYCKVFLAQEHIRIKQWCWLLLPMMAGGFWMLGTGGRQVLRGIVLLYYAVGFALSFCVTISARVRH